MDNQETNKEEVKAEEPVPQTSIDFKPEPIKVTDEQKDTFFKAWLSDQPYTEVHQLFGGRFPIKFKSLNVTENSDVMRQISLDQQRNIAKNDDTYFLKIVQYRLGLSIDEINGVKFFPHITKESVKEDSVEGITYVSERAKEFDKWPVFKLAGVQGAFRDFESRVLQLTTLLEDPDFWKAAV